MNFFSKFILFKNYSNYKNPLNSMIFLDFFLINRDEQQDVGGMLVELTQKEIRMKNFFSKVYWNFRVRSFKVL